MRPIRRWMLCAGLAALAAVASGCATPLRGQLTAFHEWPIDAPRSYRFVRTPPQRDSLEHATWENALRPELARAGFGESASPRFEIGFEYRIDRHLSRVTELQPTLQPYLWFGSFGPHAGFGFGGPWPWWGPTYYPVTSDRLWYEYRLRIEISDLAAKPPQRVYEGTAVSAGYVPEPGEVLPLLARAIMGDFPGPSGVTRTVEISRERAQ